MPKPNKILHKLSSIQKRIIKEYHKLIPPNIVEIEGIKIRIGNHISKTIRKALYLGYYEDLEMKMVKHWLSQEDIVMEIGTGLGLISSYCAKKIGSERVFTYEANPELERHIYDNFKLNGVSPKLESCLIGMRTGEKMFYLEKNFWTSSINPINPNAKPVKVTMKSFNEEVKKNNPSFLIMDVEGGEYEVLQQADFYNIRKISIEIHEKFIGREKAEFVKATLEQAGFRIEPEFSSKAKTGLENLFWIRH